MPEPGDIFQITIVSELEGVAMRNNVYLALVTMGNLTTLAEVAGIYGDEYIRVSNQLLTTQLNYVAFIVDNLTRNEVRGIVTSDSSGIVAEGAHPQDQVIRINEFAPDSDSNAMRRGAFNLSGVGESFSGEGRLLDVTQFNQLVLLLSSQFLDSPSGLTMNPEVRRRIPASQPPAFTFHRITKAEVNPTFFKLKSRKTTVLGI